MNSLKQKLLLLVLCLFALTRAHAQMGWARSYNISTAIPGATWNDVCKVLKVDQKRHIVAGTLSNGSAVVARFSQDGIAGWVRELKGVPGSAITLKDIVESKDPANPGYVICGAYYFGSTDYNYLARLDDQGNVLWDHYWHVNARLMALVLTAGNDIIATGSATSGGVLTTTAYRFDNAGNALNAKIISTDPEMFPVDILEDPLYNGTGGFFILANFKNVGTTDRQAYCIFINNNLSFVQSYVLPFNPPPPQPFLYTYVEPVCFEQDLNTRDLIILANAKGGARDFRPAIIKFNPASFASVSSVVLEATSFSNTEPLQGSALNLINGTITDGIMVVAVRNPITNPKSYTWRMNAALKTTDFFEQWLAIPNVSNRSLCLAKDNQHYVLAGHDAGSFLTLNVVNLNGDKIDIAGTSKCITSEGWRDEHPPVLPTTYNYSSNNLSVNPASVTTSDPRSWWHDGACWCAEVPAETYYRYAYPQVPYDSWELDINRATRSIIGNIYITNTLTFTSPAKAYAIELNAAGQNTNTFGTFSGFEKDGRQMLQSRHNGELIMISRSATPGGAPKTTVSRFAPGGTPTIWGIEYQNAQTPGRMYMAEALNNTDIIIAADIDGPDETSNTHDLMIARVTSGGGTVYYQEIPITYNGAQRDNFRVHALEPTRDGGFAICGSSGYQNSDFIAGFVMKFDASGTLVWQYDFRRQTPNNCYDLNGPNDCRSASVFYDLRHSPVNGYYIAGYTSDHDQNGQSSSFWNGLVVHLNNLGVELAVQEYNDVDGRLTSFKGITVAGNDIGIVGDLADPGMAGRTDLFVRLDRTTLGTVVAQTYGHGNNSSLHDIFQASAGGAGYVMVGSTTDWHDQLTPQAISTDANGSTGCETPVDLGTATPVNDMVLLDLNTPVFHIHNANVDELGPTCVETFDICEPVAPAVMRQPTGLNDFGKPGKGKDKEASGITVYPNPASTLLNLEVPKDVKVREITIVDINGRVVYHSAALMGNHTEINISELPEGMYAVKMETSNGKRFTRFVKL
jgi:hypothetical protein